MLCLLEEKNEDVFGFDQWKGVDVAESDFVILDPTNPTPRELENK